MRVMLMLAALLGLGTPAMAQSGLEEAKDWCIRRNGAALDAVIAGCTWVIRAGQESTVNVAISFHNRGVARSEQGDRAGAMADYTEAIRLNPGYANAFNNRGVARSDQGDKAGAIADYTEAIRLNPGYALAFYNRGNARSEQDDKAGAIADYNEAIRLNPGYAPAFINRGNVRRAMDDLRGARADYDAALRLEPRNNSALTNRCVLRFRQEEAGALADCQAGIAAAAATNGWPHAARAGLALLRNDQAAAAADIAEALRRDPRSYSALRLRAVLRARRGDAAGAQADMAAARAILPRIDTAIVEAFGADILR